MGGFSAAGTPRPRPALGTLTFGVMDTNCEQSWCKYAQNSFSGGI